MSDLQQSLRRFLTAAEELESAAPPEDDPQRHGVGARLRNSVVRPLRQAHRGNAGGNRLDGTLLWAVPRLFRNDRTPPTARAAAAKLADSR